MKSSRKVARMFLDAGLNPVPIGAGGSKAPLRKLHGTLMSEEEIENYDFKNIGISTGIVSGGVEALDFDLKNAEDPEAIMEAYKSKVPDELLLKLVAQRTTSGGYHLIYRCEDITTSKKLAKNANGLAIIETRGEGGLIKCAPSEGYEVIQGSLLEIPILKPSERLSLWIAAKMLNQTLMKEASKRYSREDNKFLEKFPEYNSDQEIGIALLEDHGWTVHSEDKEWVNLTRPDKDIADGISAGYHKEGKFLFVFSTSQDTFDTEKPYNNHAIYAELECGGNYRKAYAKLIEDGYGIDDSELDNRSDSEKKAEKWEESVDDLSFLSDEIEENGYLETIRKDEVELGLSFGWRALDPYMRAKENSLNFGLGYDGVGKSVMMLSLATATNVLHGWRWGMVMPENKTGMSRRRLIECASGRQVKDFKDSPELYQDYLDQCRRDFKIISNKKHYSIKDVIKMGKRLYEYAGINALLIDPYNFFKVSGDGYSHNNEILSQLRVFAESYCSVWVMAHPSSGAPRNNISESGYLMAPNKYQIQGGADFPYRVDDFFVTHRIVNHSDNQVRRTMQIIVEKVKETETGGKVHDQGDWSELIWEERNGFLGYWDQNGDNPMYKHLQAKIGVRRALTGITPQEAF